VTALLGRVTPVVRVAPAKLNLTLAVVGRRPDGYHVLHSVMATMDLADRLALGPAFGPEDRLHVVGDGSGPVPDLGPERENLVRRALDAARRAIRAAGDDRPLPALAVRLEKRIPVAAGLAGGSSDAVAALDGALEAGAWRISSTRRRGRPWPLRSAPTARSSWPAAGRPSRDAESACGLCRRPAARRPAWSS
jgi:4-diphosphocytidyl-2C-methyl-D-erythritol kinase